jgi:hypothetical protein
MAPSTHLVPTHQQRQLYTIWSPHGPIYTRNLRVASPDRHLSQQNWLYTLPTVFGSGIAVVGSGLPATLAATFTWAYWIGCQVLASFVVEMATARGFIAIEVALGKAASPIDIAAMFASHSLGESIFVAGGTRSCKILY